MRPSLFGRGKSKVFIIPLHGNELGKVLHSLVFLFQVNHLFQRLGYVYCIKGKLCIIADKSSNSFKYAHIAIWVEKKPLHPSPDVGARSYLFINPSSFDIGMVSSPPAP